MMKIFLLMHPFSITILLLQFVTLITAVALGDTPRAPEHALIQTFRHTNAMCQGWRSEVAAYRAAQTFADGATESAVSAHEYNQISI